MEAAVQRVRRLGGRVLGGGGVSGSWDGDGPAGAPPLSQAASRDRSIVIDRKTANRFFMHDPSRTYSCLPAKWISSPL